MVTGREFPIPKNKHKIEAQQIRVYFKTTSTQQTPDMGSYT